VLVFLSIGSPRIELKGVKIPIRRSGLDSAVSGGVLRRRSGFASAEVARLFGSFVAATS
jgi:hypothetical protein